jgi:hypothetical protein
MNPCGNGGRAGGGRAVPAPARGRRHPLAARPGGYAGYGRSMGRHKRPWRANTEERCSPVQ